MTPHKFSAVAGTIACAFAALIIATPCRAADTESLGLPEGVLAKMARLKAKQYGENKRREAEQDGGAPANDNAACGSLNVGNVATGGKRAGAPKQVNVIVTGDVINANNKCR
jgi:hypothetical protein